ncbi:MAG TPA: DNA internalization-related competence protein ComEC/Rec2 [Bacillales bacterium]|nr:DNA internalization-related competence protein ComEC/Rec2 [Bacillales bacterium]
MKGRWHIAAFSAAVGIAAAFFHLYWVFAFIPPAVMFGYGLWKRRLLPVVCAILFVLSFCDFLHVDHANVTKIPPAQTHLIGTISSLPSLDGDQLTFQMKSKSGEKVRVVYYLQKPQQIPMIKSLRFGMTCRFSGKFEKPSLPGNFYGFNYRQYLYRRHIHWQFTPHSISSTSCQAANDSFYDRLEQWRGSGIRWIETHFPPHIRGISEALLFGWRNNVPAKVLQAYRDLGIIHLLAVSGLHVGLVVSALYFFMIRIGITKERSIEILFLLLPLYIFMTGAPPSASRAGFMAMLVLASMRFRRRFHPLDSISWAALLLLAINPYQLFQVGFQLSFLVSFTLIVSAPYLQTCYQSRLAQLIAVSVLAQVIALPILLYRFYSISVLSLPLNLIFVPFISFFVLPLVFLGFFASLFAPFLGHPLLTLLSFAIRLAHGLLLAVDSRPWGMLVFGKPPLWLIFLMYVVIFYGLLKWESGRRKKRLIRPLLIFAGVCLFQWVSPYLSDTGEVTMLDVGQGDSILVTLPHRRAVYLIDTGGTIHFGEEPWQKQKQGFKVGRDVVLNELKARGIRSINRLILTHGDRDHIGGTGALLGHIHIDEIVYGKGAIIKPLPRKLLTRAVHLGIGVVRVGNGTSWKAGKAVFTVLNPDGTETGNDRSVVITARLGGVTWLFTGDLQEKGERRIISEYPQLKADILKVGHHGSKTSSSEAFLDQIDPKVALISVGQHNLYGQPSPVVVKRLKAHGIKVLRTDQNGAIRFWFGGGRKTFSWVKDRDQESQNN